MKLSAKEIKKKRIDSGLSRREVSELMNVSIRTVEKWETEKGQDARKMHPAFCELYLIKLKEFIRLK